MTPSDELKKVTGAHNFIVTIENDVLIVQSDLTQVIGLASGEIERKVKGVASNFRGDSVIVATSGGWMQLHDRNYPGGYRPEWIQFMVRKYADPALPQTREYLVRVMYHPKLNEWLHAQPDNMRNLLGAVHENLQYLPKRMKNILQEMEEMK